MAVGIEKTNIR